MNIITQEQALSHLKVGHTFVFKNKGWEITEVLDDRFKFNRIKPKRRYNKDMYITFEYYMKYNHLFTTPK